MESGRTWIDPSVVSGLVRGKRIEPPKPPWLRRDLGSEPPVPSKPLDRMVLSSQLLTM